MKLRSLVGYSILAILTIVSYISVYETLVALGAEGTIIVSNLTLNMVMFAMALGGLIPWYINKKDLPKWTIVPGLTIVAVIWLVILKLGGVSLRF